MSLGEGGGGLKLDDKGEDLNHQKLAVESHIADKRGCNESLKTLWNKTQYMRRRFIPENVCVLTKS